ncbi:hypothetical protein RRG08_005089 [Elysia crispata]|uniref:Uncharacterized protein n=1 Tax=Elysia crispata TaxID=231223 RepID=A0AAE0Y050_9GAST|nr:hypothetical protein RRG08_005089 [Elysia crispata]
MQSSGLRARPVVGVSRQHALYPATQWLPACDPARWHTRLWWENVLCVLKNKVAHRRAEVKNKVIKLIQHATSLFFNILVRLTQRRDVLSMRGSGDSSAPTTQWLLEVCFDADMQLNFDLACSKACGQSLLELAPDKHMVPGPHVTSSTTQDRWSAVPHQSIISPSASSDQYQTVGGSNETPYSPDPHSHPPCLHRVPQSSSLDAGLPECPHFCQKSARRVSHAPQTPSLSLLQRKPRRGWGAEQRSLETPFLSEILRP